MINKRLFLTLQCQTDGEVLSWLHGVDGLTVSHGVILRNQLHGIDTEFLFL